MPDDRAALDRGRIFRIATWNVLYGKALGDRIVEFLDHADADVAALQELSDEHIRRIAGSGRWHVTRSPDQSNARVSSFLGVVSKAPLQTHRVVELPADRPAPPLFARLTATTGTETALLARLEVGGKPLELLNLHLTCAARPSARRRERDAAIKALSTDTPAVVLGDFNAMARRWINPAFAIPFGFRVGDLLLDELAELSAWAAGHGLAGVADGVTYPWLGLQLDQIFVRGVTVAGARVLDRRFGSDHRPVVVDLAV